MYQRIYPEPEREFALDNELNQIKNAKDKALPPTTTKTSNQNVGDKSTKTKPKFA